MSGQVGQVGQAEQVNGELLRTWRPIGPRLLVRQIDPNSGAELYKPESASEENATRECEIVDIGHIEQSSPFFGQFRRGQRVIIAKYKGAVAELYGEDLIIVDVETDVLLAKYDQEGVPL